MRKPVALCGLAMALIVGCKKQVFTVAQSAPGSSSPGAAGSELSPEAKFHKEQGGYFLSMEVRGDGQTTSINMNNPKMMRPELDADGKALKLTPKGPIFQVQFKRVPPYQPESASTVSPASAGDTGILQLYVDGNGHLRSATCKGSKVDWTEESADGLTMLIVNPSATGIRVTFERQGEAQDYISMLKREGKL